MVVRMIFQVITQLFRCSLGGWIHLPLLLWLSWGAMRGGSQQPKPPGEPKDWLPKKKKSWICETMRATRIWYSVKPWNMIMKWSSKPALLGMVEIPTGLGSESKSLCFCNPCHPREMPDCHDPRKARNMHSSMWHFRLVWNEIMLIHNIDPNVMSFATSHLPACPPEKLLTQMS